MVEYLGYLASLMILVSMLMRDMVKFRYVNTVACLMFVFYGVFRNDTPIILLNATVVIINIFYLFIRKK